MKSVVITGSSGGIGAAMVHAYQEAGFYTIGIDKVSKNIADVELEYDIGSIVRDDSLLNAFTLELARHLDGSDLKALVNNAAVQILDDINNIKISDFLYTMNVNVNAAFVLSKILYSRLSNAGGCIINLGSIHAQLTKPGFISYSTSKAALKGLTQAMAVDFGDKVRVNVIQPAAISTDMLVDGFKENPDGLELLGSYHPSGGIGKPEEIAKLTLFISSDECRFINGATIDVNGAIGVRLHDPD